MRAASLPPSRRIPHLAWLVVAALAATYGPVAAQSEDCPERDPRTCAAYDVFSPLERWPLGPDRRHHIPYWVNPVQPRLPTEVAVAAIRAAASTWEAADPTVRFDYQGLTAVPPGLPDGINVVGWGDIVLFVAVTSPNPGDHPSLHGAEADTILNIHFPYGWYPCEQADGSCTDIQRQHLDDWYLTAPFGPWPDDVLGDSTTFAYCDLQNVMTHEFGH